MSLPHTSLDALVQAVDGPPVAIGLRLTITRDGNRNWDYNFGKPDSNAVAVPFGRWMVEKHPQDAAAQNGILTAKYASEWGAELEAGGCDCVSGC